MSENTKTTHTPGPYHRIDNMLYALTPFIGEKRKWAPEMVNRWSCFVNRDSRKPMGAPKEELEAVATLFAAAPELLSALEAVLNHYVGLVESGDAGNWDAETEEPVIQARAAIAKARGEA